MSEAGSNVNYSGYVEYGTRRSRPFPYMEIALVDSAERVRALAEEEWAKAAGI